MKKTIALALLATSVMYTGCQEKRYESNTETDILRTNFVTKDSLIIHRDSRGKLKLIKNDYPVKGAYMTRIEIATPPSGWRGDLSHRENYTRRKAHRTPELHDDSLFIAGEIMWYKYLNRILDQEKRESEIQAEKAIKRIRDATNYILGK